MDNNNRFKFTYSAPTEEERREIESIRRQYESKPETQNKTAELRRLDAHVKNSATAASLALGVAGALVMGFGMALVMELDNFILGIILGVVGIAMMAPAYFVYRTVLEYKKKKYGARILALSEELLSGFGEEEKA